MVYRKGWCHHSDQLKASSLAVSMLLAASRISLELGFMQAQMSHEVSSHEDTDQFTQSTTNASGQGHDGHIMLNSGCSLVALPYLGGIYLAVASTS